VGMKVLVKVPLPLVGGVVAGLAKHVPDGGNAGVEAWLPGAVAVVEHLVVRRLQAGQDDRPRRRTHDSAGVVLSERDAGPLQPLVSGQRKPLGPLRRIALLVREEKENVQASLAAAGRGV